MSATRIWIQLEKEVYTCGEAVKGTINVICSNVLPNQQLKFKLKGYEETKWVELIHIPVTPERPLTIPDNQIHQLEDVDCSDDSSDSDDEETAGVYKSKQQYIRKRNNEVYQVRRGEGKYRIMNQVQNLGQITVGHHCFPFQFNSLKEWPGTFFQEENKEKGKIKYHLTAYYGPYKVKNEVYLQEFKVAEQDKHSVASNISAWCCVGQGKLQLDVLFLKDALYIGEQQNIKIKIDCTQLQCNISSISCSLVNRLTFRSDEGTQKSSSINVFSKNYQGCQSGQLKEFDESFIISFPNAKQANRPTCNGKKITSEYMIYISANNDASCACCSDNASVGNSTHIFSKPLAPISQPFFDPNFKPIVLPVLNIPITAPTQKKIKNPTPANVQQGVQIHPQINNHNTGIGMQQPVMQNNNQFQQPVSQQQNLIPQNNQYQPQVQQGVQINPQINHNPGIGMQQPIMQNHNQVQQSQNQPQNNQSAPQVQQGVQFQQSNVQNQGIGQQQGIQMQAMQQNQHPNGQQQQQQQQQQGIPMQQFQIQNQGINQQQGIQQQQFQSQPIQQNQGIGQQGQIYQEQPQAFQQQGINIQQQTVHQGQNINNNQNGIGQQQPILQPQQPQAQVQNGIQIQPQIQIQTGVQIQQGQSGPGHRNFGAASSNTQGGYN